MARKGARAAPARKKSCISGLSDEDLASIQDALDSGQRLDLALLLRMVGADRPCPGFQASQCKVGLLLVADTEPRLYMLHYNEW